MISFQYEIYLDPFGGSFLEKSLTESIGGEQEQTPNV